MRRQAACGVAVILLAGCSRPAPPPKPVATVVDACSAARAYVAYRNRTAHRVIVFPQTISAMEAAPLGPSSSGKAKRGMFPGFGKLTDQVVFALPSDCLANLPQKSAGPGSLEQGLGADYASLPAVSEDGSEAVILVNEHCNDRQCLTGRFIYLQRDAAGVWTVVEDALSVIS